MKAGSGKHIVIGTVPFVHAKRYMVVSCVYACYLHEYTCYKLS